MKAELTIPQELVDLISDKVVEKLLPQVKEHNGNTVGDAVFDKKGLSEYLKVSASTVNKLVSNKQIPHFKINHGQSGGVRFYKRDIDKWIAKQTIPEINGVTIKLRK